MKRTFASPFPRLSRRLRICPQSTRFTTPGIPWLGNLSPCYKEGAPISSVAVRSTCLQAGTIRGYASLSGSCGPASLTTTIEQSDSHSDILTTSPPLSPPHAAWAPALRLPKTFWFHAALIADINPLQSIFVAMFPFLRALDFVLGGENAVPEDEWGV